MSIAPPRPGIRIPAEPGRHPVATTTFLGGVAAFVLRHRRAVIALWIVLLVAGGISAGKVNKRLTFDFSLPGQPGYETAARIIHTYGNGGDQPPSILVVSAPSGEGITAGEPAVAAAFADVRRSEPSLRVVDFGVTGDARFLTADGHATFALVFSPPANGFGADKQVDAAQSIVGRQLPGYGVGLTGLGQLSSGGSSKGPGVLVETLIGGAGALIVLAFVFASLLAFMPLLVAAVSILTTFLVVLGLTYLTQVSFIVEFLIALVGLGIAIDYSLLLVTRWREERARGADNATAVVTAVETAGRAVVLSGLTVAIGLVALVVLPVPGLRSTGIGGMLIPLVSILVVNTLLPALLGGIGPRIDWPRIRKEQRASRAWSAWGRGVVRWRWAAAGLAIVLLGLFAIPALQIKVGETGVNSLAKTGSAHAAYEELVAGGVQQGVLTPVEVLTTSRAAVSVREMVARVPGITTAVLPSGATGSRSGTSDIIAVPKYATVNNKTLAPVSAVELALRHVPGVIGVTGAGAIEQDYSHAVFGNFPLMFSLIALVTFLLLARAFRSLLLAGKAVVLNLMSLAATFGLMTWFWQQGHGSSTVFGIPATGAITFWIPLMVFAFLFGLSMDYEVFILTRVREEYDRTGNTNAAVTEGLGRTGRLVTSAALILFLAFASLASAPDTDIKVLATGLGAGILLDATIVRALLVPALVSLFGRWNWWFPRRVSRALAVRVPQHQHHPEPVVAEV
ncbi:MAG TPA: MMPL family transporter [Acidimicrobiales bacterium]|nr:MMPL family transporter [Acidimicrobiales bacterium]